MMQKNIYEISKEGRRGYYFDTYDLEDYSKSFEIPDKFRREEAPRLPQVSENYVVRHFTNLSNRNYGVDTGMYPLGSCTMKYNPKINEVIAAMPNFSHTHPSWREKHVQGNMKIIYELQGMLSELTGMPGISLQPAAGSHGELTGLMIMKQYLIDQGDVHKKNIIIPDSAHGTNPASVTMAGFVAKEVKSNAEGTIDMDALELLIDENTAGLMLTNPNTLGLFEKDILDITKRIHDVGGLVYCDGANMNANMGITRPLEMGFDIVHLNLHKTLSTPHGGGGPGSGPVGVVSRLKEYLPGPIVIASDEDFYTFKMPAKSIGHVKNYFGNFGVYLRAYVYFLTMGGEGLKLASQLAVLNANYMKACLKDAYKVPYKALCKHEFVLAGLKEPGDVSTLDVAKRLIDYKVHPPTIYFPLIVEQCLMIEPTESESLETLDDYINILLKIAKEAKEHPELLHNAPTTASVRRLDEVSVARNPVLSYRFNGEEK
ncbi:MAG: aminomethyl-transferring glycine dehydrogenase subunit GcvPB [Vallitaleaceae bacterium]|nr:aminomethyl-transferring glycine dehydrogenase subunit GcvPB [Vallitaleaceae bacterium]